MIILCGSFSSNIKRFEIQSDLTVSYLDEVENSGPAPSCIINSNSKKYIYCTIETSDETSSVASFVREYQTIKPINRVSSEGPGPCHLAIDQNDKYLIVSNYFGGNVAVIPINRDGSLSSAVQVIHYQQKGSFHFIRNSPHPHQAVFLHTASQPTILIPDLGQNMIITYTLNYNQEKQVLAESARWKLGNIGRGPRHLVLHHTGNYAYTLCEVSNTVFAVALDKSNGKITSTSNISTHSTLRNDEYSTSQDGKEAMNAAEIILSTDSRFLYTSTRDVQPSDTNWTTRCNITIFTVRNDEITPIQKVSSYGCHNRFMSLLNVHGQDILFVANKDRGYKKTAKGGNFVLFPIGLDGLLRNPIITEFQDEDNQKQQEILIKEPTWILPI